MASHPTISYEASLSLNSQKPASVPHKVVLRIIPEPIEHGAQISLAFSDLVDNDRSFADLNILDDNDRSFADLNILVDNDRAFPDLDSMQLAFDLDDFVEAVLVPFAPIMVTRLMTAVASFILLLSENVMAIYVFIYVWKKCL